jgi:sugar lactone lactonase YvrE
MFSRLLDPLRGKAVTLPPMDGALRPNSALDEAEALLAIEAPDNLILADGRVLFSSGGSVLALAAGGGTPETIATFPATVTALAASPGGGFAVGLDDGRIVAVGGAYGGRVVAGIGPDRLACPTAIAFLDADTLVVCQGSRHVRPSAWTLDLMRRNAAGSVWRLSLASGAEARLADGLAFPHGLLIAESGDLVVSESWRHRIVRIGAREGSAPEPVLVNLPAYPSRLAPAAGGGAWLCLFAPRSRLIEFLLDEDDYRDAMLREIPEELWIAPALSSGRSFLEPLQCGGVRTMGIHKPWAPSRSYGLLVRLDENLRPAASFHSRADGIRHGITSALERDGHMLVASKGANAILHLAAKGRPGA